MIPAENAKVDDDLFGIDLGPNHAGAEPADPAEEASTPAKPPNRTLTERLAAAAAEREDVNPD